MRSYKTHKQILESEIIEQLLSKAVDLVEEAGSELVPHISRLIPDCPNIDFVLPQRSSASFEFPSENVKKSTLFCMIYGILRFHIDLSKPENAEDLNKKAHKIKNKLWDQAIDAVQAGEEHSKNAKPYYLQVPVKQVDGTTQNFLAKYFIECSESLDHQVAFMGAMASPLIM